MKLAQLKLRSRLAGAYLLGWIAIGLLTGGPATETLAHAGRFSYFFGLFVGFWAPTFFILSNRIDRYAEKAV